MVTAVQTTRRANDGAVEMMQRRRQELRLDLNAAQSGPTDRPRESADGGNVPSHTAGSAPLDGEVSIDTVDSRPPDVVQ